MTQETTMSEPATTTTTSDPEAAGGLPITKVAIGIATLVGLYFLSKTAGGYIPQFNAWVESLGFWGPLVFIAGYAAAVVGFVPGSLLTAAAGAIFGVVAGTAYVFVAASIGATLAFLVSRYAARSAIEAKMRGNERFAAIDRAVADQGRKIVFLLRLSPVFPFSLLNYAIGLTRVKLADYVIACFGMLPGTVLYVYLGKVAGDAVAVAGGAQSKTAAEWAFIGTGLLVTIIVTVYVTRIARKALDEATGE
jgi:uncharacterized membrane protein YdjX (TVP38/TMEM64 family)